ncbi:MAG: hypothetical protein ACHQ4H_04875 [Ktedonobacterales bacterium]
MARSVVGLFASAAMAERAIDDLQSAGFDPTQMGLVMRDRSGAKQVSASPDVSLTAGAVTGGVLGGTAGALLAASGALVVPGIGPFIAGGILATALVGGAAGWLIGGLVGLGIPEEEAKYYQSRVESGGVLLTVATPYRGRDAWEIMHRDGAEDLRAKEFGGTPGEASGQTYAEPPNSAVDGTSVPPDNRTPVHETQGNAVSSLTAENGYQPGTPPPGTPAPNTSAPDTRPVRGEATAGSPESAHVPPKQAEEAVIGGFDAPDHPTTDADIIAEGTGSPGEPERPPV